MNLKDRIADNIVSLVIAMRTAQKMRIGMPEGAAKSAASEIEHQYRKKLNEAADLYVTLPSGEPSSSTDVPSKER